MMLTYIFYIYTLIIVSSASTSYQYVRVSKPNSVRPSKSSYYVSSKSGSGRSARSYHHSLNIFEDNGNLLSDNRIFLPQFTSDGDLSFSPEELAQFSHDLSGYRDPLLLTGRAAQIAVRYIYGKGELFFGDYPHVKALLKNQDKRVKNGLAGHKLGSLRITSPFRRYPFSLKHASYI